MYRFRSIIVVVVLRLKWLHANRDTVGRGRLHYLGIIHNGNENRAQLAIAKCRRDSE